MHSNGINILNVKILFLFLKKLFLRMLKKKLTQETREEHIKTMIFFLFSSKLNILKYN
jgi:hypothetical protein